MKGGFKKIHENPKVNTAGFDVNPQNINRKGLNRKTVGSILKELKERGIERVSPMEIYDTYLSLINMPPEELKTLVKERDNTMISLVGSAILSGKGFDVLEKMFNRTLGENLEKYVNAVEGDDLAKRAIKLRDSIIDKHYRFFERNEQILISEGGSRSGKTANFIRYAILQNVFGKFDLNVIAPSFKMLDSGSFIDAKEFVEQYEIDCKFPASASGQIKFPNGGIIRFEVVTSENEAKRNRDNVFINEADGLPEGVANLIIGRARLRVFIDYNPTKLFWTEKYKKQNNTQKSDWKDNPFLSQQQLDWFARLELGKDAPVGSPERYAYEVYYLGVQSALGSNVFRDEDFKFWDKLPEKFEHVISYADPSLGVGADFFAAGLFGISGQQVYLLDSVFSQFETAETYLKRLTAWNSIYNNAEHFIESNGFGKVIFNKILSSYVNNGTLHAVSNHDSKGGDIVLYSPEAKRVLFNDSQTTREIIKQCVGFPNLEHDDAPDMLCRAQKIIGRLFV